MVLPLDSMRDIALVAVFALALFKTCQRMIRHRRAQAFAEAHGCEPAPKRRQKWYYFGADTLVESYRHKKQFHYLELLQQNFTEYGLTYTSSVLGTSKLTTIDPANVEAILKTQWSDFLARPARKIPLDGLVGPGILTADGNLWSTHRKLMQPSFKRKSLEDFGLYDEHFERLLQHLPTPGQVTDLQKLFFGFTLDTSTQHLLGCSSGTLAPSSVVSPEPELAGAFDRSQRAAVEKFALGWADRFRPQLQYWRDTSRVHRFADRYVKLALQRKRDNNDASLEKQESKGTSEGSASASLPRARLNFLDELCERTQNHDDIRKGALHMLVAGRDSTASLLSNLWFMLARDKRVWHKLKEEVDALQGAQPGSENLRDMTYLRFCINESLRCHPAIPWSLRAAGQDTTLPSGGGPDQKSPIFVKAGTTVLIPLYCLHRRVEFWGADADRFYPERWEDAKPGWSYIPFLAGPRMCLGYQFAINTASYVTVRMIQELESISPAAKGPWKEELGLSMASADGVHVRLAYRKDKASAVPHM